MPGDSKHNGQGGRILADGGGTGLGGSWRGKWRGFVSRPNVEMPSLY